MTMEETSQAVETTPSRSQSPFDNLTAAVSSSSMETPSVSQQQQPQQDPTSSFPPIDLKSLLADSKLVCMKDRDLVPDALFAAMAQMEPCRLLHADRVGCYKSRELGFVGFRCKHCGGQPGFGRYFPNSVRSLAQTTTSQTILKHIGGKCRFCPADVRESILELQRQQSVRESLPTGRPRYGSRKIFFQRVWQRLHEDAASTTTTLEEEHQHEVPQQGTISANSSISSLQSDSGSDEEVCAVNGKRKESFEEDALPMRKRSKSDDSLSYPTQVSTV